MHLYRKPSKQNLVEIWIIVVQRVKDQSRIRDQLQYNAKIL